MKKDRIQIFNYKNYEKRPDFKRYYELTRIIAISLIILSIIFILLKWYILILPILLIAMIRNYIQYKIMLKYLSFNAYVIKNNILYKIGTYPKKNSLPTDEEFRMDKHKIYDNFVNWGTVLIAGRYLSDKHISRSVKPMMNINNSEFVEKMFEIRDVNSMIYEIKKIYSYEYNDSYDSYDIICDVKDYYNEIQYTNVKLRISKKYDKNNILEDYIKSNNLNNKSVKEG